MQANIGATAQRTRGARGQIHTPLTTTIEDASRITGLGRTKLYELISSGTLKSVTVGRRRLVLYSSIEALVKGAAA